MERDELAGSGDDHPELFPRNGINSLRIAQRCALQPKLASGLSQLLLLLLGFLDAIAVLDPLVVLPAVSKQAEQENRSQCRHDDVITMAFRVDLADHAVVDDPFLDRKSTRLNPVT